MIMGMKKGISVGKGFNKEIYALRFALTTSCNLDCGYCFVKKDDRVFRFECAEKILDVFLSSPGGTKLLMIYGGEPLLHFPLLKRVIAFSREAAARNGKKLIVSIGTNGILLDGENLAFFNDADVKVSLTLDGRKRYHDKARRTKGGVGSFDAVMRTVPLLVDRIDKRNRCVLFGVLPNSVDSLFDNFLYILGLGFDSVNVETIQSPLFEWSDIRKKRFREEMTRVAEYIYDNIGKGKFAFLNSINRELKDGSVSAAYSDAVCPFLCNLEVYPDGEMTFSPFLMNSPEKADHIVGTADTGFIGKYASCTYDSRSGRCRRCLGDYGRSGRSEKIPADDVVKTRNVYSIYMARKILERAKGDILFRRYVDEARERIFE